MICKNCQTYYVRDPCPNCGLDSTKQEEDNKKTSTGLGKDSVRPSQIRERENSTGSTVLVQKEDEERLVKPSQRFKQEKQSDENIPSFQRFEQSQGEEHLVKPSERIKKEEKEEDLPSFKKFDQNQTDQTYLRPSQRLRHEQAKKEDEEEEDIPSFARYQQDDDIDVTNLSKLNKPGTQDRLKNDKAYRNKVKETLEEVMGLLEKLIDDE